MMTDSSGFPCPSCGAPIRVELGRLLSAAPVFCSGCGLKLQLDVAASAGGLEAARTYKTIVRKQNGRDPAR